MNSQIPGICDWVCFTCSACMRMLYKRTGKMLVPPQSTKFQQWCVGNGRLKHTLFFQYLTFQVPHDSECVLLLFVVVSKSRSTLCNSMDCSSPNSSVHGFSRQEHWSGLPSLPPTPGHLPNPGIETVSPALQVCSLLLGHQGSLKKYETLHKFVCHLC